MHNHIGDDTSVIVPVNSSYCISAEIVTSRLDKNTFLTLSNLATHYTSSEAN